MTFYKTNRNSLKLQKKSFSRKTRKDLLTRSNRVSNPKHTYLLSKVLKKSIGICVIRERILSFHSSSKHIEKREKKSVTRDINEDNKRLYPRYKRYIFLFPYKRDKTLPENNTRR